MLIAVGKHVQDKLHVESLLCYLTWRLKIAKEILPKYPSSSCFKVVYWKVLLIGAAVDSVSLKHEKLIQYILTARSFKLRLYEFTWYLSHLNVR